MLEHIQYTCTWLHEWISITQPNNYMYSTQIQVNAWPLGIICLRGCHGKGFCWLQYLFNWVIFHSFFVVCWPFSQLTFLKNSFRNRIRVSNSLDPNLDRHSVGPDLGPNCLQRLSVGYKICSCSHRVKHDFVLGFTCTHWCILLSVIT